MSYIDTLPPKAKQELTAQLYLGRKAWNKRVKDAQRREAMTYAIHMLLFGGSALLAAWCYL